MRAVLEIVSGPETARRIGLLPGETRTIGRGVQADEPFPHDVQMSAVHFTLGFDGATAWIEDMDSVTGTWVNDVGCGQMDLSDGDRVAAGTTVFSLVLESDSESPDDERTTIFATGSGTHGTPWVPLVSLVDPVVPADLRGPAVPWRPDVQARPVFGSRDEHVLWLLGRETEPLYMVLDAARDDGVLPLLRASGEQFQSLFDGRRGEELAEVAPYLVALRPGSGFRDKVVGRGWARSWGIFLTCGRPFRDVRRHLRRFLQVETDEGRRVFFRYYDPRVLRAFLPACTFEERAGFLGPLASVLMEGRRGQTVVRYTAAGELTHPVTSVTAAEGAAGFMVVGSG